MIYLFYFLYTGTAVIVQVNDRLMQQYGSTVYIGMAMGGSAL